MMWSTDVVKGCGQRLWSQAVKKGSGASKALTPMCGQPSMGDSGRARTIWSREGHGKVTGRSREGHGKVTGRSREGHGKVTGNLLWAIPDEPRPHTSQSAVSESG